MIAIGLRSGWRRSELIARRGIRKHRRRAAVRRRAARDPLRIMLPLVSRVRHQSDEQAVLVADLPALARALVEPGVGHDAALASDLHTSHSAAWPSSDSNSRRSVRLIGRQRSQIQVSLPRCGACPGRSQPIWPRSFQRSFAVFVGFFVVVTVVVLVGRGDTPHARGASGLVPRDHARRTRKDLGRSRTRASFISEGRTRLPELARLLGLSAFLAMRVSARGRNRHWWRPCYSRPNVQCCGRPLPQNRTPHRQDRYAILCRLTGLPYSYALNLQDHMIRTAALEAL